MGILFLVPATIMVLTSLKTGDELRSSDLFSLPRRFDLSAWTVAWSSACSGIECRGLQAGFWNSIKILVPSLILSIWFGALVGYCLSFWQTRGANIMAGILFVGAFIPQQVFLYPLVRILSQLGIYNSLAGIVAIHTLFGLPIVSFLYRSYYAGLPRELISAARVDGAGFWQIFILIVIPMSAPITIVAAIIQTTGIWNDYLLGLIFAGRDNLPMTAQLQNIIGSDTGERNYNVNMAATLLTAAVPLALYLVSGRWFVRGISAGAVKG